MSLRYAPDQIGQRRTEQGLATSQADLVDTTAHKEIDEVQYFVIGQGGLGGIERDAFGGHAVATPQVAPFGEGNAQVGVLATVRVGEHMLRATAGGVLGKKMMIGPSRFQQLLPGWIFFFFFFFLTCCICEVDLDIAILTRGWIIAWAIGRDITQ